MLLLFCTKHPEVCPVKEKIKKVETGRLRVELQAIAPLSDNGLHGECYKHYVLLAAWLAARFQGGVDYLAFESANSLD